MPLDPSIPLSVRTPTFDPLGAAQAGMQIQSEQQLRQLRQQEIESGQYQQLLRQRQLGGTMAYMKALRQNTSVNAASGESTTNDQAVVGALNQQGYPEWADMHLERVSKAKTAWDNSRRADLGLRQTNIASALAELHGVDDAPDPQMAYEAAIARLDKMRFDTSEFPVNYSKAALDKARQSLGDESATIERTLKPSEVAQREAVTKKDLAEADKAQAEAGYLKNFGKLSGPEAEFMRLYAEKLGKPMASMSLDEYTKAMGMFRAANADPAMRELMLSQRGMANALQQMLLRSINAPGAGPSRAPTIDEKRPDPNDEASGKPVAEWGGLTPNDVYQGAMRSLATGAPPSAGFGGNPLRMMQANAINHKVSQIAASAGMDVPTFSAFYKANAASLTQQIKASDNVAQQLRTADANSLLLDQAMAKVPDIGSEILNMPWRLFDKKVLGDPNMSAFRTYLRSVQNEYARIITMSSTGGGGSVLSDSARREAEELADPNSTVGQMGASLAALRAEGGNRLKSVGDQVKEIQRRIQAGPTAPQDAAQSAPDARLLKDGFARTFNEGPFKGQRWTLRNGAPFRLPDQ